jgi:two-component system, NtrC family, sensor histidine kinase GlrK
MKITTRIALGLALLTTLTVVVMGYQLRTVHQLQSINQELSLTNLEAARISIRLVQELEGVREFAAKSLVLEDTDYVEQWRTWEEAVDQDLEQLATLELGPQERQAYRDLAMGWRGYLREIAPLRTDEEARPSGAELLPVLDRIEELLGDLRVSVEEVIDANQAEVARQAEASAAVGVRATQISWAAALGAGALGLLICLVLYLSISGPLRRLTRGTREIAEGRFEHRLPARGRDELSDLAQDFNRMAEKLDELEDMKRDFVSHVSHELKGPLAAIHETILVLLEGIPGPLNEKQAQLLALSRQSATRLSGMISNLLEVSRIEGGAMAMDAGWVDPVELVGMVMEELAPLARERELKVELVQGDEAPPSPMMADGDRLHEVVGNLLGNAIKFTPRGGRITLRMTGTGSPPSQAREGVRNEAPPFLLLEVEDDGPGIPQEHRTGVFEKFYQVKRGVRLRGQGVGLGLAICLNVVRAHGGAIWVEKGATGGALFRVLIPQVPRELEESARGADGRIPGGIAGTKDIPEGPSWPGPDTSPALGDRTPRAGSGVGIS